jgi:hypothetical protein
MAARPVITNVAMSNFGVPLTGLVQKTPIILSNAPAGYAWAGDVDSGDAISIGADYGIYDTDQSLPVPVEVTNWRDPA